MDAGVLVVGNEILDGLIVDTNSNWLTGRLKALAVNVREIMAVRDDIQEIAKLS